MQKKIIIWSVVAIIIGLGFLGFGDGHLIIGDIALASWNVAPNATDNQSLIDLAAILDTVLNFLYIIIRPLLAITGLALDNSLVYWEVFNLTPMLRRFWSVMMNIAFILLALGILRDILQMLWNGKLYAELPKKLLNRFLAGIFIPMSRFILSALIDLSTILIYQVGSIPLTIMGDVNDIDMRVLNNSSTINLVDRQNQTNQDAWGFRFTSLYSCGDEAYVPCAFVKNKMSQVEHERLLTGKRLEFEGNEIALQRLEQWKWYCALSPTVLMRFQDWLDLSNATEVAQSIKDGTWHMEAKACSKISDLINQSKSMVWPLYTIYGSLLNFTSLNVTTSGKSVEAEVILFLIKWIVWLLLVIPLIALAFTALARIGILWIVIAFSPFIVLYKFLGQNTKFIKDIGDNLWFKFGKAINYKPDLGGIISLIFQPVLVIFALGISIIFLTATNQMLGPTADKHSITEALWIIIDNNTDPDYQTYSIQTNWEHTTDIKIRKFEWEYATSIFFDLFTRIIANILWILIMRKLMFAALKTSSMTQEIVDKTQEVWENFIKTRPIFGGYTYKTLSEQTPKFVDDVIKYYTQDTTEQAGKDLFGRMKAKLPWSVESAKHNGAFVPDSGKTVDELSYDDAAGKLAEGITSTNKDNFHYLNPSDTPLLKEYANKLNISSNNIEWMVSDTNFWNRMLQNEKWVSMIKTKLNATIWEDAAQAKEAATTLAGPSKYQELQDNLKKRYSSPDRSFTKITDIANKTNTFYKINVSNGVGNITRFQTVLDDNGNFKAPGDIKLPINIDKNRADRIAEANNFTKGNEDLHKKIVSEFGIPTTNTNDPNKAYSDGKSFIIWTAPVPPNTPAQNQTPSVQ